MFSEAGVRTLRLHHNQFIPHGLHFNETFSQALMPHLTAGTGILCYDVPRARLVERLCLATGKLPGRDFRLACCEDLHELSQNWPDLTRAGFDRYAFGRGVSQLMLELLSEKPGDGSSRLFPVTFTAGSTAGTPVTPSPASSHRSREQS